jgi:hypothetical protein
MVPVVQPGDKRKTVGPIWPTVRGLLTVAALPPVIYLEVGTNLPLPSAPKGATSRRASVELFITSTSGNDNRRRGAGAGSLRAALSPCQTKHEASQIRLVRPGDEG